MKILVCIANHGSKQLSYLDMALNEYSKFDKDFGISVVLFSTQSNHDLIRKYPSLHIVEKIYGTQEGAGLPHHHKEYMEQQLNGYDLFVYSENDMLITQKNIEHFISMSKICEGTNYIPGFLRYELCGDPKVKSIIDCHPRYSKPVGGPRWTVLKEKMSIGGMNFFTPWNIHQGCYVLLRDQYEKVLKQYGYFKTQGYSGGMLETAATGTYAFCGFQKVISYDALEDCLIHHIPNKYCGKAMFPIDDLRKMYLDKK